MVGPTDRMVLNIVMNGISKYHSGTIETGKFTIEHVNCTEWYIQIPFGYYCDRQVYH